ncbi:MAG: transcription termination factor NusA [Candidatus Aminicenantia bacterium]
MEENILQMVHQLSKERGVDPSFIIKAIKEAVMEASKKYYKAKDIVRLDFDQKTGEVVVFVNKKVVQKVSNPEKEIAWEQARKINPNVKIGNIITVNVSAEILGRIPAQTAKQIIFQKVSEAERLYVYNEFSSKISMLVTGVVSRFDNDNVIIHLDKAEGLLPRKERPASETYKRGEIIKAVIIDVLKESRGPQIILSRSDNLFLRRLMELEIPEIADGTIEIKGITRIPGERAKVAVYSKNRDVDPVGSCIGIKGGRINHILKELRGEKIDIIQWSASLEEFVRNTMSPAKVAIVRKLDDEVRKLEVIVPESQLSIAIGKKGQNVRLASRLLGWQLEIKTNENKIEELEGRLSSNSGRDSDGEN